MVARRWRVRLGARAAADFAEILRWTEDRFGGRQAQKYQAVLRAALRHIATDPYAHPSRARDDDVGKGFRSLHVARPGRHLVLYHVDGEQVLVARILHDSMEPSHHLGPDDAQS